MQIFLTFSHILILSLIFLGCSDDSSEIVPNTAPQAIDQNLTLDEDNSIAIVLSGSDADGNALSYRIVRNPRHGQFQGPTTNLRYIPFSDYNGNDNFTFVANDGRADSPAATVRLSITPVNDIPIANDLTYTIENRSSSILLNARDGDGDALSYSYSDPQHGTLSGTPPVLTYLPESGYLGSDSFEYSANDGENDSNLATVTINIVDGLVNISGQITYDYVPGSASGLDYAGTTVKPARKVVVQLLDTQGIPLKETVTDSDGNYLFSGLQNTGKVKVRVLARLLKDDLLPFWDVKVVDNTNDNALYVMDGALTDTGLTDNIRNLHAPSGWDGNRYATNRTAAPFAILDTVYSAIKKVLSAQNDADFKPLIVNWSVNNKTTDGDLALGEIGTSFYEDANLYILGDADGDTDEYDNHIITHEWGHYYEDKFSRSDSLGGPHGQGDTLDIRVAFGEGWGNAFSAIALDDPIYFDTSGIGQREGFEINIEDDVHENPGWFSEDSVQRIIYDLYDAHDDAANSDTLSLGFTPIHEVMKNGEKNTSAFTSIFTFITAIKDAKASNTDAIDRIVSSEDIATIEDIYGLGRTNRSADYPYINTTVGSATRFSTHTLNGTYNKLGNRQFVKFSITRAATYTITVSQNGGTDGDPDFELFKTTPFTHLTTSEEQGGPERLRIFLESGTYLLDISEFNNLSLANFTITVQ